MVVEAYRKTRILSYLILLILHYICHHSCSQIKTQLGLNMISGQITHPLEKLFKQSFIIFFAAIFPEFFSFLHYLICCIVVQFFEEWIAADPECYQPISSTNITRIGLLSHTSSREATPVETNPASAQHFRISWERSYRDWRYAWRTSRRSVAANTLIGRSFSINGYTRCRFV